MAGFGLLVVGAAASAATSATAAAALQSRLLLLLLACSGLTCAFVLTRELPREPPSPVELARKFGYRANSYPVVTADGFTLGLHRVRSSRTGKGAPAVFVQHGIFCSSADWIVPGPGRALALVLADAGFDVWLGNTRGNRYSRQHTSLQTSDFAFWDFSFHESGLYDLPAEFDFIVAKTGNPRIFFVGHSMGSTMLMVLGALRPGYLASRVDSAVLLAPVTNLTASYSPVFRSIVSVSDPILKPVSRVLRQSQIFLPPSTLPASRPPSVTMNWVRNVCGPGATKAMTDMCRTVLFTLVGFDEPQLDRDMLRTIFQYTPAGTSFRNILHYLQLSSVTENKGENFRAFDYGPHENYIRYGNSIPPEYDLSQFPLPVAVFWSANDWLATPKDVLALAQRLPNVTHIRRVPLKAFNHVDYMWAKDGKSLLFDSIVRQLQIFGANTL